MKKFTTYLMSLLFVFAAMVANAAEYSVYFDNSTANWTTVNVYGWNGVDFGTWPGSAVTEQTSEGYYVVTVTADADPSTLGAKIIFNNGSKQTADLAWVTNAIYNQSGNTGNLYGGGEVEMFEFSVYFDNSTANWSTVNVYGWNGVNFGNWPGSAITEQTAEGYYKVTVKETVSPAGASIIFNDGSSQTADLIWVDDAIYNENGNTGNLYGGGVITPDYETLVYNVTVPAGTPACYIVGAFNDWGAFVPMEMVDETHYTITLDNVTKATEYKYTSGESWDNVEMMADGITDVQNRTWSENDVVEAWKGASAPVDPETPETLVYNVTVPAGTPACYIVGAFNDWATFVSMDMVDETHYTITIDNVTKSAGYKYTCGEAWDYVEMQADGITDVQDRTWSENDVVEAWKAMPSDEPEVPETLTYSVEVPAGTYACYIAGGMNDWTFSEMTKVDDTHYTITFENVTKSTEYKYFNGPEFQYAECYADYNYRANRKWAESDVVEAWENTWSNVAGVEVATAQVFGANDVLCIRTAEEATFNIYNAQGMLVKVVTVDGAADINLTGGLYIVNGAKVLVY